MYIPKYAAENRLEVLHALIEANPLAMLVSVHEGKPYVSHLPLHLDESKQNLIGHLAIANPHLKIMRANPEILCVFRGAQGYVSPRWYSPSVEGDQQVPTWNYAVAHARGTVELLEDAASKSSVLDHMIRAQEPRLEGEAWVYAPNDADHAELIRGIAAFRIRIDALEGKFKLGQNREERDRGGAIEGLRAQPGDAPKALSKAMEDAWRD